MKLALFALCGRGCFGRPIDGDACSTERTVGLAVDQAQNAEEPMTATGAVRKDHSRAAQISDQFSAALETASPGPTQILGVDVLPGQDNLLLPSLTKPLSISDFFWGMTRCASGSPIPPVAVGLQLRHLVREVVLGDFLGAGASGGKVFKGTWWGSVVAMKLMVSPDPDALQLSTREALFSRSLSHPQLVQTYAIHVSQLTEEDLRPLQHHRHHHHQANRLPQQMQKQEHMHGASRAAACAGSDAAQCDGAAAGPATGAAAFAAAAAGDNELSYSGAWINRFLDSALLTTTAEAGMGVGDEAGTDAASHSRWNGHLQEKQMEPGASHNPEPAATLPPAASSAFVSGMPPSPPASATGQQPHCQGALPSPPFNEPHLEQQLQEPPQQQQQQQQELLDCLPQAGDGDLVNACADNFLVTQMHGPLSTPGTWQPGDRGMPASTGHNVDSAAVLRASRAVISGTEATAWGAGASGATVATMATSFAFSRPQPQVRSQAGPPPMVELLPGVKQQQQQQLAWSFVAHKTLEEVQPKEQEQDAEAPPDGAATSTDPANPIQPSSAIVNATTTTTVAAAAAATAPMGFGMAAANHSLPVGSQLHPCGPSRAGVARPHAVASASTRALTSASAARFLQELHVMGAVPGRYLTCVVMEYCDRGTLLTWIQQRNTTTTTTAGGRGRGGAGAAGAAGETGAGPAEAVGEGAGVQDQSAVAAAAAAELRSDGSIGGGGRGSGSGVGCGPAGLAASLELLRNALEIAQGMAYLHSLGLVHGDLKPANVLLRTTGAGVTAAGSQRVLASMGTGGAAAGIGDPWVSPGGPQLQPPAQSTDGFSRGYCCKVADFGLTSCVSPCAGGSSSSLSGHPGAPAYMAPEVAGGSPLDKPADVYSYGVLLWHMVSGARPYANLRPAQVLVGLASGELSPLEWPAGSEPTLRKIGSAAMCREPGGRPTFDRIVRALIKAVERTAARAGNNPNHHHHRSKAAAAASSGPQNARTTAIAAIAAAAVGTSMAAGVAATVAPTFRGLQQHGSSGGGGGGKPGAEGGTDTGPGGGWGRWEQLGSTFSSSSSSMPALQSPPPPPLPPQLPAAASGPAAAAFWIPPEAFLLGPYGAAAATSTPSGAAIAATAATSPDLAAAIATGTATFVA